MYSNDELPVIKSWCQRRQCDARLIPLLLFLGCPSDPGLYTEITLLDIAFLQLGFNA